MPEYRKAPKGEWLGYPALRSEDIEHESFAFTRFVAQSLVENRKGRVYLLMDSDLYKRFLDAVRKRFGSISTADVEKATLEAIGVWIEEVESK